MASHNGRDDKRLRSRRWFDEPGDPAMTALYLERYMNYRITPEALRFAAVGGLYGEGWV